MTGPNARGGILFIGQTAGRYGSTIELLHFLRWYGKNGARPFSLLLDAGGGLAPEYAAVTQTWAAESSRWCPGGVRSRLLSSLGLRAYARWAEKIDVRRFAARVQPALVYANTIAGANSRAIAMLDPAAPVLIHVHELESLANVHAGDALGRCLARARRFIACSAAVRDYLISGCNIEPDRVQTVHESIHVRETGPTRSRAQVLHEMHIPERALLVAGCGTADWRKGTDLFIHVAGLVTRRSSRAYFAWIGGAPMDVSRFGHDVRLAGIAEQFRFTGTVEKPLDYLAAADVFVLSSREDPYPLVCLEAAAVGKPIVCFADAGGMPEFVEEDCGYVVPYLDVTAMAERVICLLDSSECRLKMGEAAKRKVAERHDVSAAGPRIVDIIERTIAEGCGR